MKIIVITRPDFFEGETDLVNRLFEHGMERLHLRKPTATLTELKQWIESVDESFRKHIVIHDYHDLAKDYALGGIHLNMRNPKQPEWFSEEKGLRSLTVSRSCHSIEEVKMYKGQVDYMFLSPIYDSISKEGYGAAFSRETLLDAQKQGVLGKGVIALGGITAENIVEVCDMGFGGAAILGDIWMAENPCERLSVYKK